MENFIILCNQRTGSTLLQESLSQHPNIKMGVEFFHPFLNKKFSKIQKNIFEKIKFKPLIEKEIVGEIKRFSYSKKLINYFDILLKLYDGFKIIFSQIAHDSYLWDYIASKEIKIIFLKRNFLECIVSNECAIKDNKWIERNNNFLFKKNYLNLPFDKIKNYFLTFEKNNNIIEKFKKENIISIEYENLTKNYNKTMSDIFYFLNIKNFKTEMKIKKILHQTPKEIILNYYMLAEKFYHTEYAKYFYNNKLLL